MENQLRINILTNACLAVIGENDEKIRPKDEELRLQIGIQIKQMSEVIKKVRLSDTKSWDAFNHLDDAEERKKRIKSSLEIKTFKMTIKKNENKVEITDKEGKPLDVLQASSDQSLNLQTASVVVESIMFFLEFIGMKLPDDQKVIMTAIDMAVEALQKNQTLTADINRIVNANNAGDRLGIAKGIFFLVIDAFHDGILWSFVRSVLGGLTWTEWAIIAASILLLVGTGVIAEIAKLVSLLVDARFFMEKLLNLITFRDLSVLRKSIT